MIRARLLGGGLMQWGPGEEQFHMVYQQPPSIMDDPASQKREVDRPRGDPNGSMSIAENRDAFLIARALGKELV